MKTSKITSLSFLLVSLLLGSSPLRADLKVASLSTITTDLARHIGGDHVKVEGIIGPGTDPHTFEPTPGDVRKVADADLILCTGKGMEGYLSKLKDAAGRNTTFIDVGAGIPTLTMTEEGKRVDDPHWWHSVEDMKRATHIVAAAFSNADPGHASDYRQNAEAYLASLEELQRWMRVKLSELPRDRRKLVTSHDSLGYFAAENGFTIHPVKGVSTGEEPSSRHVKEIIGLIRHEGVKAVFFESIENPRAVSRISSETGAKPGGTLYSDGLGDTEASTYDTMMRHNVSTIVDALK